MNFMVLLDPSLIPPSLYVRPARPAPVPKPKKKTKQGKRKARPRKPPRPSALSRYKAATAGMVDFTIKEFADATGYKLHGAHTLIDRQVKKGTAIEVGVRPVAIGRPPLVYRWAD